MRAEGIASRYGIVVSPERLPVAEVAARFLAEQGMQGRIFTSVEEAQRWLAEPDRF
jgi:ABC-type enterobactin transport system permease subunit